MIVTKRKLLNIIFALWFASELFFQHQLISQVMLVAFCITIVICIHKISFNGIIVSMSFFICWSILNILTNHTIDATSSWDMTFTLIVNLAFFVLFIQYYRFINDIKVIFSLYCLVVLVYCMICTFLGFDSIRISGRMYIEGINVNTAAYYAVYAGLWIFYLLMSEKKANFNNYFSMFVFVLFVLMTGSRGALFSMIAGMSLLFVVNNKRFIGMKIVFVIAIGILALIFIMEIDVFYSSIGYRIEPLLDYILHGTYEEASLESRMGYTQLAFSKIKDSLFWGHGLNCFYRLDGSYGTYSHNNYAEILFSLGVTGFCIYYFPYIRNLKFYVESIFKKKNIAVIICIFILIYLISEPFRVTYYNRAFLIIPIMSYLYMAKEKKKIHYKI